MHRALLKRYMPADVMGGLAKDWSTMHRASTIPFLSRDYKLSTEVYLVAVPLFWCGLSWLVFPL